MNFSLLKQVLIPVGLLALLVVAWRSNGWAGVALVGGGLVMWGLLHVTRLVTVLRRTSDHPKGWVASAVMLHAQLRLGVGLLHVLARTRALGLRVSPDGAQPEVYRWTDSGGDFVDCSFAQGRLTHWSLHRMAASTAPPASPLVPPLEKLES